MKKEKNNKTKVKKNKLNYKNIIKLILVFLIIIILMLALIFGIYKGVICLTNMKYKQYEENMNSYGFSKLYNNTLPKSYQFVTKSEAIKIIISATLKTNDISAFIDDNYQEYPNQIWVEYAKAMGIISQDSITRENQNSKESYINIINEIANSRKILLNIEVPGNVEVNIKNYDKFSETQKESIRNLIAANLIENTNKRINGNSKVTKGMLNKLIVEYVQKDNLLTIDGAKLLTDKSKMPSNASDYPYIVENVDKSVYEMEQYYFTGILSKSSLDTYFNEKQNYETIKTVVENYLNVIFNIDFKKIDYNILKDKINENTELNTDDESLSKYVEYVKKNEIIITGQAEVQEPIIYFDGMRYRVRTKVKFDIISSKELKNLIYLDDSFNNDVYYTVGENEIVYDIPLKELFGNFYIAEKSLSNSISGKVLDTYISEGFDPMEGGE